MSFNLIVPCLIEPTLLYVDGFETAFKTHYMIE